MKETRIPTDASRHPSTSGPEPASGPRAAVYHPDLIGEGRTQRSVRSAEGCLAEAVGLAQAISLDVVAEGIVPIRKAHPATLFGTGKVEEFAATVSDNDIEVVIVDGPLTPIQQRTLERALKAKVLDRTGLILEIFGERAATREGVLQVELAHLTYQRSRLVRSWTHLERQRGGFGFLGGPGETQIEADRRQIDERIVAIRRQLDKVVRTRTEHRKARRRVPYPVVALVGYTNAGKSTLFNRLTRATVLAEDMLFATLDPTMRAIHMPNGQRVILSDTVGFISDLPTQLVAAFRATLEEVRVADLILHVRDIAHDESAAQRSDVLSVLDEIGVRDGTPILEVLNKVDLLPPEEARAVINAATRSQDQIAISAITGEGIDDLLAKASSILGRDRRVWVAVLPTTAGEALAWLHAHGEIVSSYDDEKSGAHHVIVRLDAANVGRFRKAFPGYALEPKAQTMEGEAWRDGTVG